MFITLYVGASELWLLGAIVSSGDWLIDWFSIYRPPFDTIDHNILLTRLSSWFSIHGTALNWFRSYLSSRCFRFKCNNDFSSPHTCLCGVPQGSVLGPLLFVMYTTPLSTLISSLSLNHHLYADNTTFPLLPSIRFPLQHQSLTKCSTTDLIFYDCQSSHSQLC